MGSSNSVGCCTGQVGDHPLVGPSTESLKSLSGPDEVEGSGRILSTLEARDALDFNPLGNDAVTLKQLAFELLKGGFEASGNNNVKLLRSFIDEVEHRHHDNAFHSFAHAVDGLHAVCWQGAVIAWEPLFNANIRLALTVSAIAANVGHPGLDNVFLVERRDDIACRYNDISPLENMHASQLFDILRKDGCNLFEHLPNEDFKNLRRLMIDVILSTDPTCSNLVVDEVRALCADKGPKKLFATGGAPPDTIQILGRAFLVIAEVAHQMRPIAIANSWASLLQEELCLQGDRELEMGLPVSPLRDRRLQTPRTELQLQLSLGRLAPLLGAQLRLFPSLKPASSQLSENALRWAVELQAEASRAGAAADFDARASQICGLLDTTRPFPMNRTNSKTLVSPSSGSSLYIPSQFPKSPSPSITFCPPPPGLGLSLPYGDYYDARRRPSRISILSHQSHMSTAASTYEGRPLPLVREVRRWREEQLPLRYQRAVTGDDFPEGQSARSRELVLLYVVSDEEANVKRSHEPILLNFVDRDDSSAREVFALDEALVEARKTSKCSTGYSTPKECRSGCSTPKGAQRCVDSVTTTVPSNRFDNILKMFLSNKFEENDPSTRRDSTKENSGKSLRAPRLSVVTSFFQ